MWYYQDVTAVFTTQLITKTIMILAFETLREVSKYGVISGPYFPVFGLNTKIGLNTYSARILENTDQK